jgi:hypothetical protein
MKRFFAFIVLVKLLLVLFIANSYAAKGAATVYKVTMRKVELCTGSTSVSNCDGAVTVGSGDQVVDIAAVDAGAVAGSYGQVTLLPLGVTYTHMRVTIDRKFVIKSETIDTGSSGDTDACTVTATTDGMYVTDEATDKYTHMPVRAEGGTSAEANMYMPSDNYTRCNLANCSNVDANQDMTYGSLYALYQEQHAEGDATADHMLVYKLTTPYTVSLIPPTLDIAFGTQEGVGAYEVNSLCQMWAEEPVVTITLK